MRNGVGSDALSACLPHCPVSCERDPSRELQNENTSDADAAGGLLGAAGHIAKRQRDHEADGPGEPRDAFANAPEALAVRPPEHDAAAGQCEQGQRINPRGGKRQDTAPLGRSFNDHHQRSNASVKPSSEAASV